MAKEENIIEELKSATLPVNPLYCNVVAMNTTDEVVVLSFGFVTPSNVKPYDLEDRLITTVCLPWSVAEDLLKELRGAMTEHKKESVPKTNKEQKNR